MTERGRYWQRWLGKWERSGLTQAEFEPAKLYVIEHVRPTYACRACEEKAADSGPQIVTAAKPLSPIEKGLAGPGLLAQVITSKFSDHLPLYRQEDLFGRSGHSIPRSTTCGWMASCAALVRPLVERMKVLVFQSKVIGTDDTPVPVLDPQRGKTRTGRLWVYMGDRGQIPDAALPVRSLGSQTRSSEISEAAVSESILSVGP